MAAPRPAYSPSPKLTALAEAERKSEGTCRYCLHPAADHWADGCGGCMHGFPGRSTCMCASMNLPADWLVPASKEGADAPV